MERKILVVSLGGNLSARDAVTLSSIQEGATQVEERILTEDLISDFSYGEYDDFFTVLVYSEESNLVSEFLGVLKVSENSKHIIIAENKKILSRLAKQNMNVQLAGSTSKKKKKRDKKLSAIEQSLREDVQKNFSRVSELLKSVEPKSNFERLLESDIGCKEKLLAFHEGIKTSGARTFKQVIELAFIKNIITNEDVAELLALISKMQVFNNSYNQLDLAEINTGDMYSQKRSKLFVKELSKEKLSATIVCEVESVALAGDWYRKYIPEYNVHYEVTIQPILSEVIKKIESIKDQKVS